VWSHEPDISVARKLAVACLPPDLYADAEVKPFAQGSFHRLYYISSELTAVECLVRVALPADPFFKRERSSYIGLHSPALVYASHLRRCFRIERLKRARIRVDPVGKS
jgi:hypothetical protein